MPHAVSLTSTSASSAIDEIRSLSRPFATLFGFLFLSMLTVCVVFVLAALLYGGPSLRGIVFAAGNVACIRRLGFWLIVWGIAPTIGHQLCELTGVYDEGWLRASSIAAVVLGGLLYVIGRVMNLGREIELERASFV